MAFYRIFPSKDATVYSKYPALNTGLDEIIEATTTYDEDGAHTSRMLLEFDSTEISGTLANIVQDNQVQINLRVFKANITGMTSASTLEVYPISESWSMGTGRYGDIPKTQDGVSWIYRNYSGSDAWTSEGVTVISESRVTQSIDYYSDPDINVDITSLVLSWNSGSTNNYGLLIKQPTGSEFVEDRNVQTEFKYFSRDTHTIYPPCLEFKYDDFSWSTASLSTVDTDELLVNLKGGGVYHSESVQRMRVNVKPKIQPRTFVTQSTFTTNYYLPQSSYYAIKDLDTDEYIVDFDNTYTKISADESGSYFDIHMSGLEPERYYTVLLKTTIGNTTKVIKDDDLNFIVSKS